MKQLKLTLLLALLMSMVGAKALAYSAKVDGIYYDFSGTNATVTYYSSSSSANQNAYTGSVVIPETVTYNGNTYSVTSIGGGAFYGCKGLTSVTISNSVTRIGQSAFSGCSGLTSVTIPNSVTSIGEAAFNGTGLTSVNIPASVTSIGEGPFGDCPDLATITVDGGNSVYDSRGGCNAIIETATNTLIQGCNGSTIPVGVTSIADCAFIWSSLTSVTIPNSVTIIYGYAFEYCSGLTSVTIGNSVTSIGTDAFAGCSGLTSVTIPNSVTYIGGAAFCSCI